MKVDLSIEEINLISGALAELCFVDGIESWKVDASERFALMTECYEFGFDDCEKQLEERYGLAALSG